MATETLNESPADVERIHAGRLLQHGHAPYNHDPQEKMNYFIKLATDIGEKTIWGVDFERAIEDSGTQYGDNIQLIYQGNKPVTVKAWERDKGGEIIGTHEIQTHRNIWKVQKIDQYKVVEADAVALYKDVLSEEQAMESDTARTKIHSVGNANEAHLLNALAEYEHSIGKTLKVSYGEYAYLGDNGKEGARLAFLPKEGSLDQIGQYATVDHLRAHLEREIPLQKDRKAVSAFFALSEAYAAQSEEREEQDTERLKGSDAEISEEDEDKDNTIQPAPIQSARAVHAHEEPQEDAFVQLPSIGNTAAQATPAPGQEDGAAGEKQPRDAFEWSVYPRRKRRISAADGNARRASG